MEGPVKGDLQETIERKKEELRHSVSLYIRCESFFKRDTHPKIEVSRESIELRSQRVMVKTRSSS